MALFNSSPSWKQWLLPAYYLGTWPLRRVASRVAGALQRQPILSLFYHRVADTVLNPWTITTSGFQQQMEWLAQHFDLISLEEAQNRIRANCNPRPAVCITFDDGYADNCQTAIPFLLTRRIPFTYFVTSGNAASGQPYRHDLEWGVPLVPNTISQLRSLAAAGVEIGAHTRTHPDLSDLRDPQILRDEIVGSRVDLEQTLGCRVRYFAFPFGQFRHCHPAAMEVARQGGFAGVCSAYGGYNRPGGDAFHLLRLHGDPCFERVRNWVDHEPRFLFARQRTDAEGSRGVYGRDWV